jgi:hypothetical protein
VTVPEVVALATFPRGAPSRLHDLAHAFHAGDPAASDEVAALVAAYLAGDGGRRLPPVAWSERVAAVAVPGHLAGSVNRPVERLLARLGLEVPTLVAWPGALDRIADAPEARDGGRPRDPAAEAATLRWHMDRLDGAVGGILLVDDVVRTGATFEAAMLAAPAGLRERIAPLAVFRASG